MDLSSQHAASTIDPKLLTRVAKGEQLAFHQLYDQSSHVLYSMALRILGSREEAEEVLQGVYLDIWKKVVRYDVGRGTPIAWLITLTRSRTIDRLRTRGPRVRRQNTPVEDAQTGQSAERNAGQFESQADHALQGLIREAFANLPQLQQQAIELSYYEGLSALDIATRLDQRVDSVKTHIGLGMSKLRESLQLYWEEDESA